MMPLPDRPVRTCLLQDWHVTRSVDDPLILLTRNHGCILCAEGVFV